MSQEAGTLRRRINREGFTLVELLVVISIIAVLVAILLPAIASAKEAGRRARCMSNLRQWGIALRVYDEDFKALPPARWNVLNHFGNAGAPDVHAVLRDEYNIPESLTACPSGERWPNNVGRWNFNTGVGRLHYYYFQGWGGRPESTSNLKWGPVDAGYIVTSFPHRAIGIRPEPTLTRDTIRQHPELPMMTDLAYIADSAGPFRANHRRTAYPDGTNVLFGDGHVEWHAWVVGRSWAIFGTINDSALFWTPRFATPASATILQ